MTHAIRIVDVFTDRPFTGNQLAVVLNADDIAGETMQDVAREMNFSETTFVLTPQARSSAALVRIFTPAAELDFAGHPTVGTAWVLWKEGLLKNGADRCTLEEGVGPVSVRFEEMGAGQGGRADVLVWMTHPTVRFQEIHDDRGQMARALGLTEGDLLPKIPMQVVTTGNPFLFVALKDARAVDAAQSNNELLSKLFGTTEKRAVFLFTRAAANRLYGRMFAPHLLGIAEDAATGSAAGPLGAFAVKYGLVPRAESIAILIEQGTKMGRKSLLHVRLAYERGGDTATQIEVGGSVVPIVSGELTLPGSGR